MAARQGGGEGANAASMISSGGCMAVKPRAQRERKRFEIPFRSRCECRPRSQGCMRIGLQQSDSFTLSAACAEPMVLLRFAQTCWSDVADPCANAVTSSDFLVTTSDRPPGSHLFICGWRGWHMSLAICHPRWGQRSATWGQRSAIGDYRYENSASPGKLQVSVAVRNRTLGPTETLLV